MSSEDHVVLLGHIQVHGGGLCTGESDNVGFYIKIWGFVLLLAHSLMIIVPFICLGSSDSKLESL